MEKSIIRTDRAGVFYGTVTKKAATPAGLIVTIKDCIRLWRWDGACSLSQLAVEGPKKPGGCKFAIPVESIEVIGVIEIIPCAEKARAWRKAYYQTHKEQCRATTYAWRERNRERYRATRKALRESKRLSALTDDQLLAEIRRRGLDVTTPTNK